MPAVKTFDERGFLADLLGGLLDAVDSPVEDGQVLVLDREPLEAELFELVTPGLVLVGQEHQIVYGLGSVARIEPYPVLGYCIAESLDADDVSSRWMDQSAGAAALRKRVLDIILSLGPGADGRFSPASGHKIDFVLPGVSGGPFALVSEGGNDIAVAPFLVNYELEL